MHRATQPLNSWDLLKLLGLLLMFVDHTGYFFYPQEQWLRAIGRGAMPIFLFLTGYASNYRFNKELLALAVLMGISDFLLAGHLRTQNILFTILLCRLIFDWLEKRGKRIDRPHEWLIGALALFTSTLVVQYGSFGFLFALAGYLARRREDYSPRLPQLFIWFAIIAHGLFTVLFSEPVPTWWVMAVTLIGVGVLLSRFEIQLVLSHWSPALKRALKWASIYSGYIYALHLIALEWMTRIPF